MKTKHEVFGIQMTAGLRSSALAAAKLLAPWVDASIADLKAASNHELLDAWLAMAFLFPGLHPDDGQNREPDYITYPIPEGLPASISVCYDQSGWPVALIGLLDEMWCRYESGELSETEFYCGDSAMAGLIVPDRYTEGQQQMLACGESF